MNAILQEVRLSSSLGRAALEIAFTLPLVRALLLQTVPKFLPGKVYSYWTQLEKSVLYADIFFLGAKAVFFSLKENLAPIEALTERHLTALQVQIH